MNKPWFKNKQYGWGWTPATTEGWLVLLAWLVILVISSFVISYFWPKYFPFLWVGCVFVFTAILLVVCYKTGEKPRWNWGNDKK
jgi:hypothetical protein